MIVNLKLDISPADIMQAVQEFDEDYAYNNLDMVTALEYILSVVINADNREDTYPLIKTMDPVDRQSLVNEFRTSYIQYITRTLMDRLGR